jgi:hypothetical protein
VNINIYKINRGNFREGFVNPGRNQGMIDPPRNNGGIRTQPPRSGANGNNLGGIRNPQNDGVRSPQNSGIRTIENNGVRNPGRIKNEMGNIRSSSPKINLGGIRNESKKIMKSENAIRKIENKASKRIAIPKSKNIGRSTGSRFTSR